MVLAGLGCGENSVAPTPGSPRPLAAFDLDAGTGGRCRGSGAGQFDFWLGTWSIENTSDGSPAGVSEITSTLRGCVVEERFAAANGVRGRSLNVYDRRAERWYQTFVGVFAGNFRISGTVSGGAAMLMTGQRASFQGANPTRITWTTPAPATVRQLIENSFDGGATFQPDFDGTYRRSVTINPAPPLLPGICPRVPVFRQFDFAIGTWEVQDERGKVVGVSRITTDLDQCLVEERFEGKQGLESISYFFFDLGSGEWVRASGDDRGNHVELTGGLNGVGSFSFAGTTSEGGAVANEWRLRSDGSLLQDIHGSSGTPASRTLVYVRRH